MPNITSFLWFDAQAEEAAEFYVPIFPNSKINRTAGRTDAARAFGIGVIAYGAFSCRHSRE